MQSPANLRARNWSKKKKDSIIGSKERTRRWEKAIPKKLFMEQILIHPVHPLHRKLRPNRSFFVRFVNVTLSIESERKEENKEDETRPGDQSQKKLNSINEPSILLLHSTLSRL
ncbi:hypothetical protein TWF696_000827 [Orbilia brochopaga]|uniref:Uncharacterized protein n=1 Tax=Orbilia brochopaga TaxID=3140254 RepID=A0AAV9VF70_9PEZI